MELGKLHQGLTYEEYAAAPGVRASDLKSIMRSAAHYQERLKNPKKETEALRFGKLFHFAVEKPDWFRTHIVVEPEFEGVTKDGKPTKSKNASDVQNQRKEWLASLDPGAAVVSEEERYNLLGMMEAVLKHSLVGELLKNGVREVSLAAEDPETKLIMKARYDFISDKGYPVDFKTTTDARPEHFLREIFDRKGENPRFYALQGAHYSHVAKLARICDGESFTLFAVEKTAPWGIFPYPLDHACLDVGERWRKRLAKQFAECLETGTWACYEERAALVQIPQWVKWDQLEEEL